MAKLKIFTIFDGKANAYLRPFSLPNAAHAIREISEVMQQPTGPFSDYPEDFTLFEVGEFDDETGEVQPLLKHEPLGNLLRFKNDLKQRRKKNADSLTHTIADLRTAMESQKNANV